MVGRGVDFVVILNVPLDNAKTLHTLLGVVDLNFNRGSSRVSI